MVSLHSILDTRQIWLRAFYGFNPEEAGYLGFTHEKQRKEMLSRMQDGDLVLIYGAVDELTDKTLRRQALGFLEVSTKQCNDRDRSAPSAIDWKRSQGFQDRWTFGVEVPRARRVRHRVHISNVAPLAYTNEKRFERTTKAVLLTAEERARALSHPVYQVNVYGEPSIVQADLQQGVLEQLLFPSKGIPPSFGTRTTTIEDGENCLYLMILTDGAERLLGPVGPHYGLNLAKVGRSNDPKRRLSEINGGFPDRSTCRWALISTQVFPDATMTHRYEIELKEFFSRRFTSQGGEFFTAPKKAIEDEFSRFCMARMPKILGAPGKARGVI